MRGGGGGGRADTFEGAGKPVRARKAIKESKSGKKSLSP